jgi:uncharacterized protein (TIGR03435 family)
MTLLQILIGLSLMSFARAEVQTPAEAKSRRQFEVASIKPNASGPSIVQTNPLSWVGGRFTATNATLVDVIVRVYPTRRIQMRGGPDWIDADRFDIVAKADDAEGEVKPEQRSGMVQALLEDRFGLKIHVESKEVDVLALVPDKGGPKLQASSEGTLPSFVFSGGQLIFTATPVVGLVNTLANFLQTPVVDGTNIPGLFDFRLDPTRFVQPQPANSDRFQPIVDALQEQLGLKLQRRKAQLDITFIDRALKPAQ